MSRQKVKSLLAQTSHFHSCARCITAQTIPPKPDDENIPEKEEPSVEQPKPITETIQPNLQESDRFRQQPAIPDWVKKRTAPCQYEGCTNLLDPNNLRDSWKDPQTGKSYCSVHIRLCAQCDKAHPKNEMVHVKSTSRYENEGDWYCQDCADDKVSRCPNCDETVPSEDIFLPTRRNTFSMKSGGCARCSAVCPSCKRVVDKNNAYSHDGDEYCEDCFSEHFIICQNCDETVPNDFAQYIDDKSLCESCANELYTQCHNCNENIEKKDAIQVGDLDYCYGCYQDIAADQYPQSKNLNEFSYTKKDRYLNPLNKLLPITVKDLKSKHPTIAAGLTDLISFSKGKPLTPELVASYRGSIQPEEFPIQYTVW